MNNKSLTYQDLLQIVELIKSSSQFSEFHLKVGDIEIDLKRDDAISMASQPDASQTGPAFASNRHSSSKAEPTDKEVPKDDVHEAHQRRGHVGGGEVVVESDTIVVPSHGARTQAAQTDVPPDSILVKSPMVGTFYRAPEPGASPFVEVGQRVTPESTVCIIEVMKLMNSIPAGHAGIVTHIPADDGEPVEFGQVLIVISPGD